MSVGGAHLVRAHWRLLVFLSAVGVSLLVLYLLRSVVLPFAVGMALACLLRPAVSWTEARLPGNAKWRPSRRIVAIVLVLLATSVVAGLVLYFVTVSIVGATTHLLENAPRYVAEATARLQSWTEGLRMMVPESQRLQLDSLLQEGVNSLIAAGRSALMKGLSLVPATVGFIFGFAVLPLFLFYILKDSDKLKSGLYGALPPWAAEHTRNVFGILESVVGRYIRAQLLLVVVVGAVDFVGLKLLDVPAAPALAAFAGTMELVPVVGPWASGIVAFVVALATVPEKAIAVALLFAGVQVLENALLVPRIQAAYMKLHPVSVIVLLVVGAYLAGFWGLLLAVPLAATAIEIYRYGRHRVKMEDFRPTSGASLLNLDHRDQ